MATTLATRRLMIAKDTEDRKRAEERGLKRTKIRTQANHYPLHDQINQNDQKRKILSFVDSLKFLNGNAMEQKRLLERLFAGPFTARSSRDFLQYGKQIHDTAAKINSRFRDKFQADAILMIRLWPRSDRAIDVSNFWILILNPEIFNVAKKVQLRPGIDVKIADAMTLSKRRLLSYVAKHPFCSKEQIESHFPKNSIIRLRTDFKQNNLHPAIELEFPTPVLRTKTKPYLYWINPAFANTYSWEIAQPENHTELQEIFSENDVKLLQRLAKCRIATLDFLGEGKNVYWQIEKINNRCEELKLPIAIKEKNPLGRKKRFGMNQEFRQKFGFGMVNRENKLENYFSGLQAGIIRYLVNNQPASSTEIADALGLNRETVSENLNKISDICDLHGLPSVKETFSYRNAYYLPREFLEYFGLPVKPFEPEKCLRGKRQLRLYRYLEQHPRERNLLRIARILRMPKNGVHSTRRGINTRLVNFGFPPI